MTGEYKVASSGKYLYIYCVLVNNNKFEAAVTIDTASINGWEVYGGGTGSCDAGKKKKVELDFCLDDADISSIEEIEDLTFKPYIYNMTDWKTVAYIDPIVFTAASFAK